MARSLDSAWTGHDLDSFRPLTDILGAPWADIGAGLNTALAFVGAASLVHDEWPDGQAHSDTGVVETLQLIYDIPPAPSPKHTELRVTVHGASPGEDGFVQVREVVEGNWTLFELTAAGDAVTHLVPTAHDDAASQLEVRVVGEVQLQALDVEVAAWVPGAWPGGGEHPAGALSTDVDIVPFELLDVADDEPVSARVVTDAREAAAHCRARQRMYFAAAAHRIGGGAIVRPLRGAAPTVVGGSSLTVKIRAEGGAADGLVWVQAGAGAPQAIYRQETTLYIRSVEVLAAAAEAVYELTVPLRAQRNAPAPGRYPGFGWLVVWATPEVRLLSVSAWGR